MPMCSGICVPVGKLQEVMNYFDTYHIGGNSGRTEIFSLKVVA